MILFRAICILAALATTNPSARGDIYVLDGEIPFFTDSPSSDRARLIAREAAVERKLRTRLLKDCSTNPATTTLIKTYAARYRVEPALALAIAEHESGCSQSALSTKGAIGTMQLMPQTAKQLDVDPHKLEDNIKGGIKYLAFLSKALNNDIRLIAAGYNAGIGAVRKYGGIPPYPETVTYTRKVATTYNQLK